LPTLDFLHCQQIGVLFDHVVGKGKN
jgi:hypothetical protein